jgi:hypothetical protein
MGMNIVEAYKLSFDYLILKLGPEIFQFDTNKTFPKTREVFVSDGWRNCFTLSKTNARDLAVYVGGKRLSPVRDYSVQDLERSMVVINHNIVLNSEDVITVEYSALPKLERRGL